MAEKIKYIFVAALLCASVLIQGYWSQSEGDVPIRPVRVLVLKKAKNMELTVQGTSTLIDEEHPQILEDKVPGFTSRVYATSDGIWIHDKEYKTRRLALEPDREAAITLNNRRFRGHLTILAGPDRTLNVINVVDLEQYIKGVLYHEISHRWPIEAIKAQAVATRSYAVYAMQEKEGKEFDVTNDIYSQVYGGRNSERFRTSLAVDATRGQLLAYRGKVLPAFFHATCAGMTEDAVEVWNINLPPLKSVACPYCEISPHLRWKRNFRLKDIQEKLNANGYKIGLIKDITVVQRNQSDRIKLLKITGRAGEVITLSGKDFRNIIGPNDIRSNNYEVVMKGYYVDFYGRGWGHGVGLCQWGAYGMAQKEFDYKEILMHYYPGAQLIPLGELKLKL
jgi:stage II sporulation protein D